MILVISSEMFKQWRIVFERSSGAAFVHDVDVEDDDKDGVPEDGWRYCDIAGVCEHDETLRVTGELHLIYKPYSYYGYFSRRNKTPGHYQAQQHWTNSREIS